jgi:hypothetical protein
MAYNSFHNIPTETVATDEATWEIINKIIKCPENMEICDYCMSLIKKKCTKDSPSDFRRAAILVANIDFPLISEHQKLYEANYTYTDLGFLSWDVTTDYVCDYVLGRVMKDNILKNPNECFPPEWRNGLLEDDIRISDALKVLDVLNKPNSWDMYATSSGSMYEAFKYYMLRSNGERDVIKEHIESLITDCC